MTENQKNTEKGIVGETGEIISIASHRRSDPQKAPSAGTQASRNYPERNSVPVQHRAQRTASRVPGQASEKPKAMPDGRPAGHATNPSQGPAQAQNQAIRQDRQQVRPPVGQTSAQPSHRSADPVRIAKASAGRGDLQSQNREITQRRSSGVDMPSDATVIRPAVRQPSGSNPRAGAPLNTTGSARRPSGTAGAAGKPGNRSNGSRSGGINGSRNSTGRKNSPPAGRKNGGKNANTGSNGKNRKNRAKGEDSTALSSLVKAIIYITCVLVVSCLLGYFGISIGNDVFAFVKEDYEVSVIISESTSLDEAADILHEKGVISYPNIFKLYSKLRKKNWEPISGECIVSPAMNYDTLFAAFQYQPPEATTVSVTIPEGYTVDEIISLFVDKYGIGTREGFVDAIQNGEFDYWFIDELNANPKPARKYRLEGYLYPDTYYFYSTASPTSVISKILANFNVKMRQVLGKDWETTCAELCSKRGMSFDEIVTLASLIQMEAKYEYEYEDVSAVFTNRLNNRSISNGLLQSDATIQYFLEERNADITKDQLETDNLYNTYIYPGLPPGPITNITINAINYAFYPSDAKYCYFYAHPDGYTMFAVTYTEHLANKEIALAAKGK